MAIGAGTQIASLYAKIGADTSGLQKALRQASTSLNLAAKEMQGVGKKAAESSAATDKQRMSMQDLGIAAAKVVMPIAAVGVALKKAFDISEQGAAIVQTTASFDRLGVSIEMMRAASRGTIDDMGLMSSTLTLVAGANEELQGRMLESAPQLMEIAKAANAVNPALGDTAFMYDSIARGIKRSSPLILDNLGIIVKIGEANETYAAAIGKTVAQLTAEDKQIALLNATMAAGNRLIEQAGGSVEAYGDAWASVRAHIKNATDEMKAQSAEGLQPVIARLAEFLTASKENEWQLTNLGGSVRALTHMLGGSAEQVELLGFYFDVLSGNVSNGTDTVNKYIDGLRETAKTTDHTANAQKNLNKELQEGISILEQMRAEGSRGNVITSSISKHQRELADDIQDSANANLSYADSYDVVAEAAKRAQGAVGNYSTEFYESIRGARRQAEAELMLGAVNSDLSESFRETSDEMSDMRSERADLITQLDKLTAGHGRYITVQRESTMTTADLALAQLQLADAQAKLGEEEDPLKAARLSVQIENLQGKIEGAGGSFTSMVDNGKKISEIEGAITGVTGKMDELIGKTRDSIRSFILQQMQAQLSVDGWTESEIAFFKGTAERFGMYDDLWVTATTSVAEHALAVEDGSLTVEQAIDGMMGTSQDLADEAGVLREIAPVAFDETASAAGRATGMIDSLVGVNSDAEGAFIDLRDTAVPAVDEVALAAGLVGSALMGAVADADLLKAALDLLAENDITIDVHFNVDELRVPTAGAQELQGPGLIQTPTPIMNAAGGDYIVSQPTSFMAGEAGTERVIVIPKGQPGFGGVGGGMGGGASKIEINVHGTNDPEAAANLVIRKLADRGIVAAGGGLR